MKRILLALLLTLVASEAWAQFTPINVQLVDPTTRLPVTAANDGTVGTTAQTTGPSGKCYGSSVPPSPVTNGQDQYEWCDVSGARRVSAADPCFGQKKTFVTVSITTSTQLISGVASNRIYICSFFLTQPTNSTQTWSMVSGTGSVCATSTGAMIGGTSAAAGMSHFHGNTYGDGNGTVAKSDTDAENVCILQSTTNQIAGVIAYVIAPN